MIAAEDARQWADWIDKRVASCVPPNAWPYGISLPIDSAQQIARLLRMVPERSEPSHTKGGFRS